MTTFYLLLANVVLLVHLAFILFVVAGGWAVLRWPRLAWVHLPMALWAAGIEFFDGRCPLNPLENHLRRLGGESGFSGDFIDHYLAAIIYPEGLTREMQVALGLVVVLVNVAFYRQLWRRRPASATGRPDSKR